ASTARRSRRSRGRPGGRNRRDGRLRDPRRLRGDRTWGTFVRIDVDSSAVRHRSAESRPRGRSWSPSRGGGVMPPRVVVWNHTRCGITPADTGTAAARSDIVEERGESVNSQGPTESAEVSGPADPTVDTAEAVDAKGRPLAVEPAAVPWLEFGLFVLIAFGLAWLVCLPLWVTGQGLSDPLAVQLYGGVMMFTPLIAGFVAFLVQRRRARRRAQTLASAPRYFGFWPLRPFGRVIWTTVGAFFGIMVLVVLGYLLSGAFGWLGLDLSGLSGFEQQMATLP